jgi:hypothetical protein
MEGYAASIIGGGRRGSTFAAIVLRCVILCRLNGPFRNFLEKISSACGICPKYDVMTDEAKKMRRKVTTL